MRTLFACASLFLILSGCGYKGPLVLPKPPAPPKAAATHAAPAASAPAEIKRDASAAH
ncbi:lipoprotein [Chromobacterium sp. IIBBL 290-4]|uniref:LPS translocon maturation chaperone LptM n=1 Tax=Chromobacterium sp. IIBBL 290-4 TaxID=2953890 RepID=UPI0020B80729|nr:lipoprotein [Chromobacterium sp. IIBBL 290-4]UTH75849.1 lipoprotein [Chromobacterium sp. IIBBL 290-4]